MLAEQYRPLIRKMAKKFAFANRNVTCSLKDLEQEAWIALLRAEQRFDKNRGVKFITYAYVYVYRELMKYTSGQFRSQLDSSDAIPFVHDNCHKETEDREFVKHLLSQLSPTEKTLIDAKFSGKTYKEIASLTGMSPTTINKNITRIVNKLRNITRKELKTNESY